MTDDLWFWLGIYYLIGVALVFIGRQLVKLFHKDNRSDFVKSALAAIEEDKSPAKASRIFQERCNRILDIGCLAICICSVDQ